MEKYLIPVLNNILEAAEGIESKENASMILKVDDEAFEIDKKEVCLFDAMVNLLRAYCYMFCTYDVPEHAWTNKEEWFKAVPIPVGATRNSGSGNETEKRKNLVLLNILGPFP